MAEVGGLITGELAPPLEMNKTMKIVISTLLLLLAMCQSYRSTKLNIEFNGIQKELKLSTNFDTLASNFQKPQRIFEGDKIYDSIGIIIPSTEPPAVVIYFEKVNKWKEFNEEFAKANKPINEPRADSSYLPSQTFKGKIIINEIHILPGDNFKETILKLKEIAKTSQNTDSTRYLRTGLSYFDFGNFMINVYRSKNNRICSIELWKLGKEFLTNR